MPVTLIRTYERPRTGEGPAAGEVAEIVNQELCGARHVSASLRWLRDGQRFEAPSLADRHQLIYVVEGAGEVELEGSLYSVEKGAGVYLAPTETATCGAAQGSSLKLLHVVSPE